MIKRKNLFSPRPVLKLTLLRTGFSNPIDTKLTGHEVCLPLYNQLIIIQGEPNENIVQNHLNVALLNVF